MSLTPPFYVEVALPVPLRQAFTYLFDKPIVPTIGTRVKVPFGRRHLIGVIVKISDTGPEGIKCKPVQAILEAESVLSPLLLRLLLWASRYYQYPVGEVIQAAMPKKLREGGMLLSPITIAYSLTHPTEQTSLTSAPVQQRIVTLISETGELTEASLRTQVENYQAPLKALIKKDIVRSREIEEGPSALSSDERAKVIELNPEQKTAVAGIEEGFDMFNCSLLYGITGSGKTEVYFALIDQAITLGWQTLVLFPEIALTTQLEQRFVNRFGRYNIVSVHSGMSDTERGQAWLKSSTGKVPIVLGTRMAVFTSVKNLGLIIVDEEHDSSYKQQVGFRYHARSVAIKRAKDLQIPIVLGSATPSLESLHNVEIGRFKEFKLTKRAATEYLPKIDLVDLNHYPTEEGLTQPVLIALKENYSLAKQSMVFINRRGFAPVLYCSACQWIARCERCDAALTQHQNKNSLSCHYCGAYATIPNNCLSCHQPELVSLGEGTQRIEQAIAAVIPNARIKRFDRDEMATQSALEAGLQSVHDNETDILVGTQLLTKGHDFSNVSLVVVVNADQGLHSHDFRATEHLAAQLIQVAGRAGRSSTGGKVIIQTYHVNNPTLLAVQKHDYRRFAQEALSDRLAAGFPPYTYLAIWRAQSPEQGKAINMLQQLAKLGNQTQPTEGYLFDPCKSAMEKKAGRYRAQLLISSTSRKELNFWLQRWLIEFEKTKLSRLARWSLDVDPIDLY
jgi:primosomal protein N' (replication factor Y)